MIQCNVLHFRKNEWKCSMSIAVEGTVNSSRLLVTSPNLLIDTKTWLTAWTKLTTVKWTKTLVRMWEDTGNFLKSCSASRSILRNVFFYDFSNTFYNSFKLEFLIIIESMSFLYNCSDFSDFFCSKNWEKINKNNVRNEIPRHASLNLLCEEWEMQLFLKNSSFVVIKQYPIPASLR